MHMKEVKEPILSQRSQSPKLPLWQPELTIFVKDKELMKFGVGDFRITFSSAKDLEGFVAKELFIEAGWLVNVVGFVVQFAGNEGRWPEDLWKLSILLDM